MTYNLKRKPFIIPAVPERFCVTGIRTNCTTGVVKYVHCVIDISKCKNDFILSIVEGGVTGFESFYIKDSSFTGEKDWCACLGTHRRYDALLIQQEDMKAIYNWFKERREKELTA